MSKGLTATRKSGGSRWTTLLSICAALPDIQDPRRLLDIVVGKTADFFDAECCVAFLATDGQLLPASWVGLPPRLPPDPKVPPAGDLQEYLDRLLAPARCRRFMSAPMVAGGTELGQLAICSLRDGPPYSLEDRDMLELLAHRVAFAVEDARLLERARAQQEALARIAAALAGEVEVRKVAQSATELAIAELGADGATVWIARPEERALELLAITGFEATVAETVARLDFDGPSLAALAAATGQIQAVESPEQMPKRLAMTKRVFAEAGIQSGIAAPLVARGKLMGVFAYTRRRPHRWDLADRTLIKTVADLLASAIFNAQLYEQSERRRLLAEAVIENSPVAIMVFSGPGHRYVLVNPARERITGTPREKVLGSNFAEVMPELARGPVIEALDRVFQTGENVAIPEFRHDFGPPIGVKYVSLLYSPLKGPNDRIEGVISMMLDITEQVVARQKLERLAADLQAANEKLVRATLRSEELAELAQQRAAELEATIASIADAVFVCDPEGRITLVNRAGLETVVGAEQTGRERTLVEYLTAVRPRYSNGQPIPTEELAISRALRGEVVRGLEEIVYDARARRDRHILVSASPVRDEKGRSLGVVEVQSDITRLKELDLLKDQFITVAAHEVKTPVTAIKGFAQALMRAPGACAPKYHRALETIVQQSDRIDALIKDFVDTSRMRWGQVEISRERVNLSDLVAEVVARMAATTTRHRLLLSRKDPAWVVGDRDRLQQVLENLLDNALRYSPKGGDVEVQVVRGENRAVVSVRDQGVGIPRNRQSHLFERFYRAHVGTPYDYGGLGVGLYISRELVRQHGGEMWFESEEGKGSTFYFSLPLARDE